MSGQPVVRKWLKLYHLTGRPANFGAARVRVSADFRPVGLVCPPSPAQLAPCMNKCVIGYICATRVYITVIGFSGALGLMRLQISAVRPFLGR